MTDGAKHGTRSRFECQVGGSNGQEARGMDNAGLSYLSGNFWQFDGACFHVFLLVCVHEIVNIEK